MADVSPKKKVTGGAGLKKHIGPLPLWAWGVIVIGMYLGYRYYEKNKSASSAATDTTSSTDPSTLGTSADGSGASSGGADGTAASGTGSDGSQPYGSFPGIYEGLAPPGITPENSTTPINGSQLHLSPAAQSGEIGSGPSSSPTSNAAGSTLINPDSPGHRGIPGGLGSQSVTLK